jgi:hypothetical protein
MSLISDWLGYLAWRHGQRIADVRRQLNARALDGAWMRSCRVAISKNTITNLLKGRTREWRDDSRAFVEQVLKQDFAISCEGDDGFGLFAATLGSRLHHPTAEVPDGRGVRLAPYVGLYHLLRQSTSSGRINVNPLLIVPVGEGGLRAVLYVGRPEAGGELPKYVGELQAGSEAAHALMIGRSRPDNVRFRSLVFRLHRSNRTIPGLMTQLSDATAAPTALPVILKRQDGSPELDPGSPSFSLGALHARISAHDLGIPTEGPGALKPAQRRFLERTTLQEEEALNLFS